MSHEDAASLRLRLYILKERGRLGALLAYRNLIDSLTYGLPELQTFGDPEPGRVEGFASSDPTAEVLLTHWHRAHQLLLQAEATADTGSTVQRLAQAAASVRAIESTLESAIDSLRTKDAAEKTMRVDRARKAAIAKAARWNRVKAYAEKQHAELGLRLSTHSSAKHIANRALAAGLPHPGKSLANVEKVIYDHLLAVEKNPSESLLLLKAEENQA